jgi:hypothetical protein
MADGKNYSRKMIAVTATHSLYERCKQHCRSLDLPVTVWVRELIKRELEQPTITGLQ